MATFDHGDYVRDVDGNDHRAVVVNRPDVPAEEWELIYRNGTVAEDNPDYPADAQVVIVAYEHDMERVFPDWEGGPIPCTELHESGLRPYAFPAPRLEATGDSHVSDSEPDPEPETESDPSPEAQDLADRLEDGGMTTEFEDGETIRAEKMGTSYRVRPGEVVEGDGPFRSRLETIVEAT